MSYSIRRNFHRTSKFSSNLIVYLLFLFFAVSKKKKESLWNIFFLITQPFLYLEGALKLISQEQFKNTTTKIFQVRQQFRGSTKISTHRIWHGEHIRKIMANYFKRHHSSSSFLLICCRYTRDCPCSQKVCTGKMLHFCLS